MIAQFEQERTRLKAVAHRMLGSFAEADDALQDAWLKVERADTSDVGNPQGWLTTVVARVCLNMLRDRRDHAFEMPDPVIDTSEEPEQQAVAKDEVGLAMLVVLDTLKPDERLAFVLHDMFQEPFEQVAPLIGRTPLAALQVEARARKRVENRPVSDVDLGSQRKVVDAFMAGEAVLDDDVTLRSEGLWLRGADSVGSKARLLQAPCIEPAVVGGEAGLVSIVDDKTGGTRVVHRLQPKDRGHPCRHRPRTCA